MHPNTNTANITQGNSNNPLPLHDKLLRSNSKPAHHPWEQALSLIQQRQQKVRESLGPLTREELAALSGFDAMKSLLDGRAPILAMGRTLNFHLIEVKSGEVLFQGLPGENTHNSFGVVHVGWYASLLESALSGAIQTLLLSGQWHTTSDLNMHLVKGFKLNNGPLRARGNALHLNSHSATAQAELIDIEGKLYAHASASFKLFSLSNPDH
jgi:uncharacterized protein (TIGR00369 family)